MTIAGFNHCCSSLDSGDTENTQIVFSKVSHEDKAFKTIPPRCYEGKKRQLLGARFLYLDPSALSSRIFDNSHAGRYSFNRQVSI